jgi:hypothetical protein
MADPMFPQPMKRVVVGMGFLNKLAKKGRVGELWALKKNPAGLRRPDWPSS